MRIIGVQTQYRVAVQVLQAGRSRLPAGEQWRELAPDQAAQLVFGPLAKVAARDDHGAITLFLRNGGRIQLLDQQYLGHHTGEATRISDLVAHERAGDRLVDKVAIRALDQRQQTESSVARVQIFKRTLDPAHPDVDSFTVRPGLNLDQWQRALAPFLATRQLVTGAGFWTTDAERGRHLLLSSRALELAAGAGRVPMLEADDARQVRRLDVLAGESNLAQYSVALRLATTELVLRAIEAGERFEDLHLDDWPRVFGEVAGRRDGTSKVVVGGTETLTALEVQCRIHQRVARFADDHELRALHEQWGVVLAGLAEGRHTRFERFIDWAIKEHLVVQTARREQLQADDPRLVELDRRYHDVHRASDFRGRGAFAHAEILGDCAEFLPSVSFDLARERPVATTRAQLRGRLVAAAQAAKLRFTATWDRFALVDFPEQAINLPDPRQSQSEQVDALVAWINAHDRPTRSVQG